MGFSSGRHVLYKINWLRSDKNAKKYMEERVTFSDRRFVTSDERALREPTKFIFISVMARVMHCWNLKR